MLGNGANDDDTDTVSHLATRQRSGFRRHGWRLLFALALAVSAMVLFAPHEDVPPAPVGVDKIVHVGLFAALALSGLLAAVPRRGLAVGLLVYAAASEVIQLLPALGRSGSVADWAADAAGVGAGIWLGARAVTRFRP